MSFVSFQKTRQTLQGIQEMASQWAQNYASQKGAILLSGDLGAGKSTWSRAFIQSVCGQIHEVPSPTFNLLLPYRTQSGQDLWHMDLYRLEEETPHLDEEISEYIASSLCLIEWPERRPWLFQHPQHIATVQLIIETPETRTVQWSSHAASLR